MGVGNLPAVVASVVRHVEAYEFQRTFGKTGSQETRDLLDEGIGRNEGIVFASQLLDQLLVLVQLLQIVGGHGVDAVVLSTINVMLVTENTGANRISAMTPPCRDEVSELHSCETAFRLHDLWFDVPDTHARSRDTR